MVETGIVVSYDAIADLLKGSEAIRLAVKPTPVPGRPWRYRHCIARSAIDIPLSLCPYGAPGDRIWIKEPWALVGPPIVKSKAQSALTLRYGIDNTVTELLAGHQFADATFKRCGTDLQPAMRMPFGFSRLLYRIESLRIVVTSASALCVGRPANCDWLMDVKRI